MAVYNVAQRRRGSGIMMKGICGEVVPRGAAVYMSAADGLWYLADSDAAATLPTVGVTAERSAAAGQIVLIVLVGIVGRGDWAWNRGDTLYASGTPGVLTQVAPANAQPVAVALTATLIYVNPALAVVGGAAGAGGRTDFTYLVERDNGTYTVYDNQGAVAHGPGADADVEINWALTNGGSGAVIALEPDTTFVIDDPINFAASNQWLRGGGRGTFINGDALDTGEHAITITSDTDCVISDLSIQTQDGGGKVCHCIFIDNASSRTLIENVTIVDSDSNGIHIEGISQADTRILNCNFLNADGHGIYTNMDVANAIYFLEVRDCKFTGMSGDGIHLEDGIDCQIFDNVFDTSIGSDGIELVNSDDCHINNNNMSGATGYDINISAASCDRTRVFDNILHGTGAGCINDAGTDTKTPFIYCRVIDPTAAVGTHPATEMPDDTDTDIYDQFYVPLEFQELVTAEVVVVQTTVVTWVQNMVWTADTNFGKICVGENYNAHSDNAGDTTALDVNQLECLDVAAALTNLAAGDLVGVAFMRDGDNVNDTVAGSVYYLGIRVRYV